MSHSPNPDGILEEVTLHSRHLYVFSGRVFITRGSSPDFSGAYYIGDQAYHREPWMQSQSGGAPTIKVGVLKVRTSDQQTFWVANASGWLPKDQYAALEEKVYPETASIRVNQIRYQLTYDQLVSWLQEGELDEESAKPTDELPEGQANQELVGDQADQAAPTATNGSTEIASTDERGRRQLRYDPDSQSLTDGTRFIPVKKPTKRRLRNLGIPFSELVNLSHKDWELLVHSLEGQVWDEVKDSLSGSTNQASTPEIQLDVPVEATKPEPEIPRTPQQVMESVLAGEDFDFGNSELVIGKLRAIHVVLESRSFTVVDSIYDEGDPSRIPTGHYVFADEVMAVRYMRGKFASYREVAQHTIAGKRYNHRGDWEERVRRDMLEYARTGRVKR